MDPVGDFTDSQSGHQASPYDQQQQGYGQQYEQQHSGQYGQPYGHDEGVGGYGQGAALDLPDPPMRAQQSEPNLQIQDQAHAYAALQQAAAQAQALAYGSEPSAQTPLAPIPQHQHQQHHQQQHEQQQHQPLGYAPFDEADPFAAQKLLLQQQPDLMRAAPSQPSYSSFQEPTRSPLDPPGYTFDPLDLGKPPVAPQISGSAGDNLRRMTSGIQGVNAPNWAAVEKDLRQNTLTDFLRRMFDTLTQQHMALGKLNEAMSNCYSELKYTKQSHEAAQDTITNLRLQQESSAAHLHSLPDALHEFKTRIGDLEVDLGPTRPQAVSGPQYDTLGNVITVPTTRERAEKKTLRETVDELASQHNKLCNVVRRERYGRLKHAGWILANMNVSALQRRYFRKWLTWLKLEPDIRREQGRALMAMSALSGTRTGLRAMYWSKLKGFVNWARKQHYRADRYCRALRRVNHSCSKHRLQVYWNKLKNFLSLIAEERQAYHVANTRKAGLLANISLQALQLRYFNKLLSHRTSRVQNAEKLRIVTVLENLCFTALRKRYYSGLLASAQWKKYRRDRYDLAARLETKLLLKRYLETWAQHAAMTRRYLERIAVSRALSTKNSQRVRRTFYHLLSRYAVLRLKSREQIEMDQRFGDVLRKSDNLGTQIDVGLKTLSNTNSVLNKLVDRLIEVDRQLDGLEKEKISRREFSFITDPMRHPELLEELPPKVPHMVQADPRTSPTPTHPPLDDYVPAQMSTAHHQRLEQDRAYDQLSDARQSEEMERRGHGLGRFASEQRHPMATPPGGPARQPTPSSQRSTVDDFSQQLKAEFAKELMKEQAAYRGLTPVGRFM